MASARLALGTFSILAALVTALVGATSDAILAHDLAAADVPNAMSVNTSLVDSLFKAATSAEDEEPMSLSELERALWVLIFAVMVVVASGGNAIVIFVVLTNKQMKSITNYFLVNLSLADTMVSILNVVFNSISMLISHWPFGLIYCKVFNFIAIFSISASVFTLTAISCDRYNAILHPLRPRMLQSRALAWIALIWLSSALLALPNAVYSALVVEQQSSITCAMIWPDGRYPLSRYDHIYNIVLIVTTYFVPITTMVVLYYKVGTQLWGHEAIGDNIDSKQLRNIQAKKKIVKMMIVVVIIFALCWFPYHAFFVFNYYLPDFFTNAPLGYQRSYLTMYLLGMSNSMYNPIIIYFMNSKFRHEFKHILRFLCCCCCCAGNVGQQRASTNAKRAHCNNSTNNNNINNNGNQQQQRQQQAASSPATRKLLNLTDHAFGNCLSQSEATASSRLTAIDSDSDECRKRKQKQKQRGKQRQKALPLLAAGVESEPFICGGVSACDQQHEQHEQHEQHQQHQQQQHQQQQTIGSKQAPTFDNDSEWI